MKVTRVAHDCMEIEYYVAHSDTVLLDTDTSVTTSQEVENFRKYAKHFQCYSTVPCIKTDR